MALSDYDLHSVFLHGIATLRFHPGYSAAHTAETCMTHHEDFKEGLK